jgi:uncharacterized protein with PQ loop repeat
MAANLTPLQLFANVLCLLFVYSAFLWYYPLEPFSTERLQRKREFLRARILLGLVLLVSIVFSATSATLYYGLNLSVKTLATWGRAIGILSAVVVVVQWTPQIFTTFQLGSAGSLSVVMLIIQLPGCLLTVFFQAVIGGADITTWGPYLVSAINIMILIIMCGVFWLRNRNGIPEENFDIYLSEDEHHVFEYDKDLDALARKSYGSFSHIGQTQSNIATPSTVSGTPHSGKLAWSLSDRNGFKGNLSAASFITSGTSKRTRAHLSGKDLLGTSKPPTAGGGGFNLPGGGADDSFGEPDMFSRLDGDSGDGVAQPPPQRGRRPSASHSQRYIGSYLSSSLASNGLEGSDMASSTSYTSSKATPRKNIDHQDVINSSSVSSTSGHTPGHAHRLASMSQSHGANSSHLDPTLPPSSANSSFSATSSFSNSMSVVEQMGSFIIAPPPSPYASSKSLVTFGTLEELVESDADDVDFTVDPLNQDKNSLDTPHGTMERIKPIVQVSSSPSNSSNITIPTSIITQIDSTAKSSLLLDEPTEPSVELDPPIDS